MFPTILSRQAQGGGATRGAAFVSSRRGIYDISGAHLFHLHAARQELIDARGALGRPKHSLLLLGGRCHRDQIRIRASF